MGMEGEAVGRLPPRCVCCSLRLRLHRTRSTAKALWADPDVRWLAGVNQAGGITFFNREQFDELLTWLQLPALIEIVHAESIQPKSAHPAGIAESSLRRRRPQGRARRWLQPKEVCCTATSHLYPRRAARHPTMPARLILNADDFGLTRGINRAIGELHSAGVIRPRR